MNNIATHFNHNHLACTCPHCNSTSLTRSGFDRGTQRYRCKTCSKTFKATAGTPVHGLHKKEKIEKYLQALRKGMSVRKAAEYVGISKNTSFAWRHKFLSSLQARSAIQPTSNLSTAKIIQLKYSAKGRRKPPEKHTSPTKTVALLTDGQLELHKLPPIRQAHFAAQVFSKNTARFIATIPHKTITAGIKHSGSAIKIQNPKISQQQTAKAKQAAAELISWMQRFRGVASKYLHNYWNWYASLFNLAQLKHETEQFSRVCTNRRSLNQYRITKGL